VTGSSTESSINLKSSASSFHFPFETEQIFKGEFRSCSDELIDIDLDCLNQGNKLTDTIVKVYSHLLMKEYSDILIFDPHFYNQSLKNYELRSELVILEFFEKQDT